MNGRTVVLVLVLLFTGMFALLTLDVMRQTGFDVLVGISLVIIGMIAFGVIGALLNPPED